MFILDEEEWMVDPSFNYAARSSTAEPPPNDVLATNASTDLSTTTSSLKKESTQTNSHTIEASTADPIQLKSTPESVK